MSDALKRLRALAEEATQGPWRAENHLGRDPAFVWAPRRRVLVCNSPRQDNADANVEHIAAWSPQTALKALDVIEAAQSYLSAEDEVVMFPQTTEHYYADLRGLQMKAEVQAEALLAALERWESEG